MRYLLSLLTTSLILAASASAAMLPGFRAQKIVDTAGFPTSLDIDSRGTIYYSIRNGEIYRVAGSKSILVAKVDTANVGNEALLGIALRSDQELLAHHVLPDESGDVLSSIDVNTGGVSEIARFVCDGGRACGNEHHGGNITVAPDGTAFFSIGDYGASVPSQLPASPGGKIFRISPSNQVTQYALGVRNAYDMAWDAANNVLIVGENGPTGGDELNLVHEGDNLGWPYTFGNQPPISGDLVPSYVFEQTVAPTGMILLNGSGFLKQGLLLGSFVTQSLYYFRDSSSFTHPPDILGGSLGAVLDVSQAGDGTIYVLTTNAIYSLSTPKPGDCNGDGRVDILDSAALAHEILDGDGNDTFNAQEGGYRGSWGCDVNRDGLIDARDLVSLAHLRDSRGRPAHP